MCGIAGFIGFENNRELAFKANETQKHRGPDNQSVWHDSCIALAHQRLSIIDLSDRGNQPFHKNNLVIVFNGEIYNYKELRRKLQQSHNISFTSDSDTEVVLEYYRIFREKCLDHFIGMFAFSIYNTDDNILFLARDHFGIKPLFYQSTNSTFCFSSELKVITQTPGFTKQINYRSLLSSLNYVWVSGNESIFETCQKLPPGHYMFVAPSLKTKVVKYWEIEDMIDYSHDEDYFIQHIQDEFIQSVNRHLVADVPVSSFLSGGLDSSFISVIANKSTSHLSTYTIATEKKDKSFENMPDDEKYARSLAKQFGFNSNEIIIKPEIVENLPKLIWHLDEPIGDPAAINTYLICKTAREKGVKVILSGMGADEVLLGYRRQQALLMTQKFRDLPTPLKKLIAFGGNNLPVRIGKRGIKTTRWLKRFLTFADLPYSDGYMRSYSYYHQDQLNLLTNKNFTKEIDTLPAEHHDIFHAKYEDDLINKMCYTDINMFMTGLNLTYTDRASMAASVEVRVPFIDKEFITSCMRIPGYLKYKNNTSKYILKKAATPYLPREIICRPKASFGMPLRSWISNELKPMINDLLSESAIKKRGLLNGKEVQKMIENDRKGIEDTAIKIYHLLLNLYKYKN